MLNLAGSFVPLATPFTDDGSGVSEIRLARLVRRCQEGGAKGFVLCTDTGEFTTISFSERKAIVELVIRMTHGDAPILVNVSSLNTAASLDLAQHAVRHGVRGILLMPPYYGQFEPAEIESHFRTIVRYSETEMLAVDPQGLLTRKEREQLAALDRFSVVQPYEEGAAVRTDWFRWNDLKVSPAYNIGLKGLPQLQELLTTNHPAKVVKGVLTELDLELGPPRQPLLGLPYEAANAVAQAFLEANPPA